MAQAPLTKMHLKWVMPFKARTHKHSNKVVICMSNYLVLGQNVLSALRENPATKTQLILSVSVAANDLFGRLLWCGTEAIIEKTTIDEAVITCVGFHTKTENKRDSVFGLKTYGSSQTSYLVAVQVKLLIILFFWQDIISREHLDKEPIFLPQQLAPLPIRTFSDTVTTAVNRAFRIKSAFCINNAPRLHLALNSTWAIAGTSKHRNHMTQSEEKRKSNASPK